MIIIKIKFYDKSLLAKTISFIMFLGSVLSIIALFDANFITNNRCIIIVVCILFIVGYYIINLIRMNVLKSITLSIYGSTFEIKEGNIFENKSLKVINFNEYFDTLVDDRIIAKNSLNGKFICDKLENNVEQLDLEMSKCSLEIFMATCLSLGIWNLLPKKKLHWSHNPRAPTLIALKFGLSEGTC